MAGEPDASLMALIGSAGAAIGAIVAVLTFRRGSTDRMTKLAERVTAVEGRADTALQEAAEAKNDHDNLRDAVGDMSRDIDGVIDKRSREHGDGLASIRQHVTDLAFFVRDNFVKQSDFASAMKDIKDGQARVEKKIDDMRERLPGKH